MLDDREYLMPPDNETVKVYECYFCDTEIFEEDKCFSIDNLIYSKECTDKYFKITAEKVDISGELRDLGRHDT